MYNIGSCWYTLSALLKNNIVENFDSAPSDSQDGIDGVEFPLNDPYLSVDTERVRSKEHFEPNGMRKMLAKVSQLGKMFQKGTRSLFLIKPMKRNMAWTKIDSKNHIWRYFTRRLSPSLQMQWYASIHTGAQFVHVTASIKQTTHVGIQI